MITPVREKAFENRPTGIKVQAQNAVQKDIKSKELCSNLMPKILKHHYSYKNHRINRLQQARENYSVFSFITLPRL